MDQLLTHAKLLTPRGIVDGTVQITGGRIVAIRSRSMAGAGTRSARGCYVAPGFIDLHLWGEPSTLAPELARSGTTAFLTALGPEPAAQLARDVARRSRAMPEEGARCLGFHLEGPFLHPARGGALPKRWMRSPSTRELERLWIASGKRLKLITLAPELNGAAEAIRWCKRHRVVASLGHSDANAEVAARAVDVGATAITHAFNGMRPFHHRQPSLIDLALLDPRLTAMAIVDGVHISPSAFRLLVSAKGVEGVALVTDSVRRAGWDVVERNGALYRPDGTLAGSRLTMIDAVRNAVTLGGVSLCDAVRMATAVPARLLGDRWRGLLAIGRRADLVVFDERFRVLRTFVNGRVVYQRKTHG